ncbi:hypothetical protein KGF57_004373 [Candida theae]|uniref:Peptidase A1 domain-containing protein n=1 Tax=Candida theae TaxID=1198502 RepID=A0AAD5BBF2_9ASCO|nr:uncharacterized protein KGF57_004373 [Candida theae]KAI5950206.1 hypothetical protein KGF57_004373 [Candida theae]
MKFSTSVLVAVLASVASATPIAKRQVKYLAHQVDAYELPGNSKREELLGFTNTGTRYTTDLELGSSKEKVKVMIDTASWRLNVPGPGAKCLDTEPCPTGSVFDPERSTTFHNSSIPQSSGYGRGTTKVTSFRVYDDVFFDNGDKIPQFQFDVANATSFELGWFGIRRYSQQDASYVYSAKKAGLINTAGYSLYLGNGDQSGTLLLGAVDSDKYEGDLAFFDNTDFEVEFDSVTTGNGQTIQIGSAIGLDSGDPEIRLNQNIVDAIYKEVGANKDGDAPCANVLNVNKSLKFALGGITVDVPYSDLFYRESSGSSTCGSYITNTYATQGDQNIGLPFVKQIYLASSFDSGTFGVAPVKHTDESNIVDFWF